MIAFTQKYKSGQYSQNGEAGIIDECLRRIDPVIHNAVEFGAPNRTYCSNIYHLDGFNKYFYDLNPNDEHVTTKEITPGNVNELPACSVLSIDIDGNDYNVWKAYKRTPNIVIIEINSSIKPTEDGPVSDPGFGTAYKPMVELGISKGYFLLCHTGNLIFILNGHRKLFPEIVGDGISNYNDYFNPQWL